MGRREGAMSHMCLHKGKEHEGVRAGGCSFAGIC